MIAGISGKLVFQNEQTLRIDVGGFLYEVMVPSSVSMRVAQTCDTSGNIHLVIYHYYQVSPSSSVPFLIGFINDVERDFFLQFIKVSGIGPRAAVRALDKPISEIARAIDIGDTAYLKTLPGIGAQKAKEIVAKLQGKVGKFGLIRDEGVISDQKPSLDARPDWQEEAMSVLLQLQYKKQEAAEMIKKALDRSPGLQTTEDLINEIYKQKVHA